MNLYKAVIKQLNYSAASILENVKFLQTTETKTDLADTIKIY